MSGAEFAEVMAGIESVQRMELKPGDTLVLKSAFPLREHVAAHLKAVMEDRFPGQKILVLDSGLSVEVISES